MNPEDLVNQIMGKLSTLSGKISVIEHELDPQIQLKYFDFSRNLDLKIKNKDIDSRIAELESEITENRQKELLIMLSHKGDVKAYRAIETFEKKAIGELKDWSRLALHEAKIILEGQLLGENQLFISTGLGGSGSSLRYFIVLFSNKKTEFEEFQKKIVKNELIYSFKDSNSKLEEIEFVDNYVTIIALIPLDTAINQMFKNALETMNEFGDFMSFSFLLSNSKRMDAEEIKKIIEEESGTFNDDALEINEGFNEN